jgi:hypothetical protein
VQFNHFAWSIPPTIGVVEQLTQTIIQERRKITMEEDLARQI